MNMPENTKRPNERAKRAPKTAQMERTKRHVLNATTELLGEIAYGRITIDLISERSGVSRSTIYRHWKSLPELVSDAFDGALGPNPKMPATGDIRDELLTLFHILPKILDRSIWGRILPSIIVASNSEGDFSGRLQNIADKRRDGIRDLIKNGMERGEIKADTDIEWMIDILSGLFYHRRLITGVSMHEAGLVKKTVDTVLSSVATDKYKRALKRRENL